ncbi:MAG: hypothetical protein V1859_03190 [archaeon]
MKNRFTHAAIVIFIFMLADSLALNETIGSEYDYYYFSITDNSCTVNVSLTSNLGSFTLGASWIKDICSNVFSDAIFVHEKETKSLAKEGLYPGNYSLRVFGSGIYSISKKVSCEEDITPPYINVQYIPPHIKENYLFIANVLDESSKLSSECEICITKNESCDYIPAQINYESGAIYGNCSFFFDTAKYSDGIYNIYFRARDISNNTATSIKHTFVLDRFPPLIEYIDSPDYIDNSTMFSVSAKITDESSIKNATLIAWNSSAVMNISNGLFSANITSPKKPGEYELTIFSVDAYNQISSRSVPLRVNEKLIWSDKIKLEYDMPPNDAISVLDSLKNRHIAFSSGNEIYYTKIGPDGKLLVYNKRLTENIYNSNSPFISVDDYSNINIVWEDDRDANSEIYYSKLDVSANTLLDNKRLTRNLYAQKNPKIFSQNNTIYLFWIDNRNGEDSLYFKMLDIKGEAISQDTKLGDSTVYFDYTLDFQKNNIIVIYETSEHFLYYIKMDLKGNIISASDMHTGSFPSVKAITGGIIIAYEENGIFYDALNSDMILINKTRLSDSGTIPKAAVEGNNIYVAWRAESSDKIILSKISGTVNFLIKESVIARAEKISSFSLNAAPLFHDIIFSGTDSFYLVTTAALEKKAPVISQVTITEITAESAKVKWVTDEPSTGLCYYGTAFPLSNKTSAKGLNKSHEIIVYGLVPLSANYLAASSADILNNIAFNNNNGQYFLVQTPDLNYKPELPTSFYGYGVYSNNNSRFPGLTVTATWQDAAIITKKTTAITLSKSNYLNDSGYEGFFFFNKGDVLAKTGTIITLSSAGAVNQPYINALPGGNATEALNGPLRVDASPPQLTIISPENKTYNSKNITFRFTSDENLLYAGFSLNKNPTVTVTGMVNKDISINAKVGSNSLALYATDLLGQSSEKTVSFYIMDTVAPVVEVTKTNKISGNALLRAEVYDSTNALIKPCEICISTDNVCDSEWTSQNVAFDLTEGSMEGNCEYYFDTLNAAQRTYLVNFRAYDEANNLGTGIPVVAVIDNNPPDKIKSISAFSEKANEISLSWQGTNAEDFAHYNIYRSTQNFSLAFDSIKVASTDTIQYMDKNLAENSVFYYAVTAVDDLENELLSVEPIIAVVNDFTPPEIVISSPQNITYSSAKIILSYVGSEKLEWCAYKLNTMPNVTAYSGILINATEGQNSIILYCADSASNMGQKNGEFVIDTIAPSVITELSIADIPNNNWLSLNWKKANDADFSGYKIYRKDSKFNNTQDAALIAEIYDINTVTFIDKNLVSMNTYYYAVAAVDMAGNEKIEVVSVSGTVADTIPPDTVTTNVRTVINDTTLEVSWQKSSASDFSHYNIYRASSPYELIDSIYDKNTTGFMDSGLASAKEYYYKVTVADINGNENKNIPGIKATVYDMVPPIITITSPKNKMYNSLQNQLIFGADETVRNCRYNINGIMDNANSGSYFNSNEGTNTLVLQCNDANDNLGQTMVAFNVDTIPPQQVSNLIISADTLNNKFTLSWQNISDARYYKIFYSNSDFTDVQYASLISTASLNNYVVDKITPGKNYYFAVAGVDYAENMNAFVISKHASIPDFTPPIITISSPMNNKTYNTKNITLFYTTNEAVNCSFTLNGITNKAAAATFSIQGSEGNNYLSLECTDPSGNKGYSAVSFIVDTIAPEKISYVSISGISGKSELILSWTPHSNDISYYNIYRSKEGYSYASDLLKIGSVANPSYHDYVSSSDNYFYSVTGVDYAGNEDKVVTNFIGKVGDIFAPSITISSPLPKTYNATGINIIFKANEEVLTCVYSHNNVGNSTITSPYSINGFEGINRIDIYCTDLAGNIGSSSVIFGVDTTSPAQITNLIVNAISKTNALRLTWKKSVEQDIDDYYIYRSGQFSLSIAEMAFIGKTKNIDYTDYGLESEKAYYYGVYAKDIYGNFNSAIAPANGTVADTIPPKQVSWLSALQMPDTIGLSINWENINDKNLGGYKLYRSENNFSDTTFLKEIAATAIVNYIDLKVEDGKVYYYAAAALDAAGNENKTVIAFAGITPDITPPIITVDDIGAIAAGKVLLSATAIDYGYGIDTNCKICIAKKGENCEFIYAENNFAPKSKIGICSFEWDTANIEKTNYTYVFSVSDISNNSRRSLEKDIEIINQSDELSFILNFEPGWNLFSLPLIPIDNSIASLLVPISGKYERVFSYEPSQSRWKTFKEDRQVTDAQNELLSLSPGKSYWIFMKQKAALELHGYSIRTFSLSFSKGWNFFGYWSLDETTILSALSTISGKFNRVYAYNSSLQKWELFKPVESSSEINSIKHLKPGIGYVIDIKSDDIKLILGQDLCNCNVDEICVDGICLCASTCEPGSRICASGLSYKSCGQYDNDTCYEWSEIAACAAGKLCSGGDCICTGESCGCSDTDEKNFYVKGTVWLLIDPQTTYEDYCTESSANYTVNEYYCNETGTVSITRYDCLSNCTNGACQ